jgi:N utilization substance protein B
LLFAEETPAKEAINEAIELAKRYSTESSPTFVNGILDRIYVDSRPSVEETGEGKGAAGRAGEDAL